MSDHSNSVVKPLNTKILMTTSAAVLGVLGFGALLFSQEVLTAIGGRSEGEVVTLVGILGTLYLSFGLLNWMAREKLIGGIYSRPVAIGNFTHFLAGTIVLADQVLATTFPVVLGTVTGLYALLAAGFGYVAFAGGGSCG